MKYLFYCTLPCVLLVTCCDYALFSRPAAFQRPSTRVHEIVASMSGNDPSYRTWRAIKISDEQLLALHFTNNEYGWVGGNNNLLYRTTDGGETWQRVSINVPISGNITDVFFASNSEGWVILQQSRTDHFDTEADKVWLLYTSDAGQSWTVQHASDAAQLRRVVFINGQEGWAVGSKIVRRPTVRAELLVLHTTDGGRHWVDISTQANRAASNGRGQTGVVDIVLTEHSKTILLTYDGLLLNTSDAGRSWEQTARLETRPMIAQLASTPNNSLRVVAGATGTIGATSFLAQQTNDGSWVEYIANGVRFRDAAYISDTQVLACGSMSTADSSTFDQERMNGVILHSLDSGRTWTIAYSNMEVRSVICIFVVDANHVWAIGEGGLLLKTTPDQ